MVQVERSVQRVSVPSALFAARSVRDALATQVLRDEILRL